MKHGKLPAKHDERTLQLWHIFDPSKYPAAQDFDWAAALPDDMGMMRNDQIGLCTIAGAAHMIQIWTSLNGGEVTLTDDVVEDAYKAITLKVNGRAYDPKDPTTDTGLALLDVLKYWRAEGIGGHKIGAFAKLRHEDINEIRAAGRAFGGLYTGAMLPESAELQVGQTWEPTRPLGDEADAPGSWGGHCMALCAAKGGDPKDRIDHLPAAGTLRRMNPPDDSRVKYVTWGKRQEATLDWVARYADEMYVVLSQDWITGARPAPSGLNLDRLRDYLANV